MNRGHAVAVGAALDLVPLPVRTLCACDFMIGVDPLFAGLHRFHTTSDRRSYRDTAHVAYPFHQRHRPVAARRTTVVLPTRCDLDLPVIVHELGHVLGFSVAVEPVSRYAQVNRMEAFAEAFTSWLFPGYAQRPGERVLALFDQLASP